MTEEEAPRQKRKVVRDPYLSTGLTYAFQYQLPRPIIAPKQKAPLLKAPDEFLNLIMESRQEADLFEQKMIVQRLKSLEEKKKLPPELVGDLDLDIESMCDKDADDAEWKEQRK
ncbi:MAG: hypothetical protein PXY39_02160 [archaeon]|nr:hypothetical protein [archaeon]